MSTYHDGELYCQVETVPEVTSVTAFEEDDGLYIIVRDDNNFVRKCFKIPTQGRAMFDAGLAAPVENRTKVPAK